MERNKEELSIRGILIPAEWDEEGNIIGLSIMTVDEKEYVVEEKTERRGLFDLVRHEVEVRGLAREEAGRKAILVESYKQIR